MYWPRKGYGTVLGVQGICADRHLDCLLSPITVKSESEENTLSNWAGGGGKISRQAELQKPRFDFRVWTCGTGYR